MSINSRVLTVRHCTPVTELDQYDQSDMLPVLVYGSLRTGEGNHSVISALESRGTYRVHGFQLYGISDVYSIPFARQEDGGEVTVELFSRPMGMGVEDWRQVLAGLDRLESSPQWYTRCRLMLIDQHSTPLHAWMYVFLEDMAQGYIQNGSPIIPTGDWLKPYEEVKENVS